MSRSLVAVLALAAALFAWRIDHPGYSDTEGMFAEPAREMVVRGDWVTPRMNGEPFLTKPPLAYWLAGAVMAVAGPTEWARIWPALAAVGTLAGTAAIGTDLFGAAVGLLAAVILATTAGIFIEARLLRADMLLVLAVTVTLLSYLRARRRGDRASRVAFWASIGLGLLDKGLLAIALPGGTIALAEAVRGRRSPAAWLGTLRPAFGAAILAAIALPWHLWAGVRNPGFLWDYVVNQHLLVFFDEKLPRDSIPDGLGFFWTMFVARGLPWTLLLPAALLHAWRRRHELPGLALVASWIAVVLLLFSLAAGRLEHYSLPALPAVALLVALLLHDAAGGRLRVGAAWLVVPPIAAGIAALGLALRDPGPTLALLDPALRGRGIETLLRPTLAALATALLGGSFLLTIGRGRLALVVAAGGTVACLVCAQLAHERLEPIFSWRPFAATIRTLEPAPHVFFRASDEYQLCGGLDYYLGHDVALLAPPGWVPPTFLAGRTSRLFTPRADLAARWHGGDAVLVADDVPDPSEEARLAPGPYTTLLRAGDRVLLRPSFRVASALSP